MVNDVVEFLANSAESGRDFANANTGFCLVCGALAMFVLTVWRTCRPRRAQPVTVATVTGEPPPLTPQEIVERYIRNALTTMVGDNWTKVVQQGSTSYRCQTEAGKALSFCLKKLGDKVTGVNLYLAGSYLTPAHVPGAKFDEDCEFTRMATTVVSILTQRENDQALAALAAKLVPTDDSEIIRKYIDAGLSLAVNYWEKGAGNLIMCRGASHSKLNVYCNEDKSYIDYFVDGVSVRDKLKPEHAAALNAKAIPLLDIFIASTGNAHARVMAVVRGV